MIKAATLFTMAFLVLSIPLEVFGGYIVVDTYASRCMGECLVSGSLWIIGMVAYVSLILTINVLVLIKLEKVFRNG